jgi:hypothetical protein
MKTSEKVEAWINLYLDVQIDEWQRGTLHRLFDGADQKPTQRRGSAPYLRCPAMRDGDQCEYSVAHPGPHRSEAGYEFRIPDDSLPTRCDQLDSVGGSPCVKLAGHDDTFHETLGGVRFR